MTGMDPLDSYVEAVTLLVPTSQRDAIARDLAAALHERMRVRQQERGRPLTTEEREEVLRQHGHPMDVAGRYRNRPQPAGSQLLPVYLLALKLGLGVALIVTVVAAFLASWAGPDPVQRIAESLLAFPRRALHVIVWTTIGFAALEIAQRRMKLFPRLDPRSLAKVSPDRSRTSRADAIVGALFALAGVVWLLLVPRMPQLLLGPAAAYVEPGPVWGVAYVPVLLVFAASAAVDLANAVWPPWTPARAHARLAVNAASLVVALMLINGGALFVAAPASVRPAGVDPAGLAQAIDGGLRVALGIWIVVAVIEMFRQMIRLKDHRLAQAAAAAAPEPWRRG